MRTLTASFFQTVARRKVRVLKSFSWLELIMSAYIKHSPIKESLAFVNSSIHEIDSDVPAVKMIMR